MKQIYVFLLSIICLTLSLNAQAQCDYQLELTDFFGNDWDSGANATANTGVDVTVDGVTTTYLIVNPSPIANEPVTETYAISVNNESSISIDYRATSFLGDGEFRLLDSENLLVYETPPAQASMMNIFTGVASCPTCPVVTNFGFSSVTATEVDLSWSNGGSETEWEVEYGVSPYTVGSGGVTVTATTNPFTLTGLNSTTTYDVYIRAACIPGADISNSIGPVTITTAESCPAPSNFTPITQSAFEVQFIWDANGNSSANYEVNYGVAPFNQGGAGGLTESGSTAPFAFVGNLTPNTTYDFYIRIDCGMGDFSSWEGPYTASTLQSCPDVSGITFSNIDQTNFDIAWNAGGTETEWEIEYAPAPLTPGSGTIVNTTTNPFTLTGLMSGTSYDICITAVCAPSDRSTPVCATVTTPADYCAGDLFLDSGGASGQYQNNENITYNICPDNPGDVVYVNFTANQMEDSLSGCFDGLTIYDGPDTTFPTINTPSGDTEWCWDNGTGTGDLTLENLIGTSASGCLTFVWSSDGSVVREGWSATVTCAPPPTCDAPRMLTLDAANSTSADISWVNNSTASEFLVEYREVGTTLFTAVTPNPTTESVSISGLASATEYEVCVTAVCDSSTNDVSVPSCTTVTTTPDYCAGDLFLDSGGASGPYQSNENITYNICPDNPGDVVQVNFTFNEMEDSFAGCWDGLTIYDGPDTTFPTINTPGGDTEWCWDNGEGTGDLTLENLIGTSASGCLTFVWSSDSSAVREGWSATVTCGPPPSCQAPSSLTVSNITGASASVNWTENGSATLWQVEVQPDGVAQGTAGAVFENLASTNPQSISGLNSLTTYDVFVRADCGMGDFSSWVGPISFTTDCSIYTLPYGSSTAAGNDFTTFPGDCWSEGNASTISSGPNGSNGAWTNDDFGNDTANAFGQAAKINLYNSAIVDNDWLVSPSFDLTNPGHNFSAQFDIALTEWADTASSNFGSDDEVQLLITDDSGVTWNNLATWNASSMISNTGQLETVSLAAYSGVVQLAFWSSRGTVADTNDVDFFIDNFTIDGTAGVDDTESFEFSYYPNPTDNSVNFNGQQVIDGIIVRNLLGQQLLVARPNATSSSIDLSAFPSGMYLIEVSSGEQRRVVKVIRN